MAVRREMVYPDESGVVTLDAMIEALTRMAVVLDFAGGNLSVVTTRAPAQWDGEMVTTSVALEWRAKTQDRPIPSQFEPNEAPRLTDEARQAVINEAATLDEGEAEVRRIEAAAAAAVQVEPTDENPDGFDYSQLEGEDVEDEPVGAR